MSLEDRLESGLPSAWRPDQEGPDTLIGTVVDIQVGSSDYGTYPIVVIRNDEGVEKAIHGFHSVLQNELKKHRPNIGERVGVKYQGEITPKSGGRPYKGYRVVVEREAGGSFDWGAIDAVEEVGGRTIYDTTGAREPVSVTAPEGAGDDDIPF